MDRRTIVVGDPHGCIEEFNELIQVVDYKQDRDHFVVAGDVFDRGPDAVGVLRKVRDMGATLVLGNHDEKHLRYSIHEQRKAQSRTYKNPMKPFSGARLAAQQALTPEDISFLSAAPRIYRLDVDWVVVHGGMEDAPIYKQNDSVLRVRYVHKDTGKMVSLKGSFDQPPDSVYWTDKWKGPENVIYGHAVHSLVSPRITTLNSVTTIGLDTGCCFGGRLSAVILDKDGSRTYAYVNAKKAYKPINGMKDY